MINIITVLLSLGLLSPNNINDFSAFKTQLNIEQQQILNENNINNFDSFEKYFYSNTASFNDRSGNGIANAYTRSQVVDNLETNFSEYDWESISFKSTDMVSNAIPICVPGPLFPAQDISTAIEQLELPTNYGGCGPIAMIGILDYFSRYLDYTEIMNDPFFQDDRVQLATDVLNMVETFTFNPNATSTTPSQYEEGFNDLMNYNYNLSSIISCSSDFDLFGDNKEYYINRVINSVSNGIPVTLFGSPFAGSGDFADHVSNICGYEKFRGYNEITNEVLEKDYIIGRLNHPSMTGIYYCDAGILNYPCMSLITYSFAYSQNFCAHADDFSTDFVNSQGNGQYFYYNLPATIYLDENTRFNTNRLRCSYIENEYLVLSPKRVDAGIAYLEIGTFSATQRFSFSASMWGPLEDHQNEIFTIQYYKNNVWNSHISIDLSKLSKDRNYLDNFIVLFPKNTHQFRFLAIHTNPVGTRNKGRIVLDNLYFQYNFS